MEGIQAMTADSLVRQINECKSPFNDSYILKSDAIAIIRRHEAEPHLIDPEEIASCTVLQMHGGSVEAPQTQPLSVDQIAEAIFNTIHFSHWHCVYKDAVPLAARARRMKGLIRALDESKRAAERIAAMPLLSADLADAEGQEEAGRPAKEFGVGVPGAAPDTPVPAWSEDGFKAACVDMAAQIQSAKIGGGEELLAKNVCVSSLCVAYKNACAQECK
jgi:hypothetical protein